MAEEDLPYDFETTDNTYYAAPRHEIHRRPLSQEKPASGNTAENTSISNNVGRTEDVCYDENDVMDQIFTSRRHRQRTNSGLEMLDSDLDDFNDTANEDSCADENPEQMGDTADQTQDNGEDLQEDTTSLEHNPASVENNAENLEQEHRENEEQMDTGAEGIKSGNSEEHQEEESSEQHESDTFLEEGCSGLSNEEVDRMNEAVSGDTGLEMDNGSQGEGEGGGYTEGGIVVNSEGMGDEMGGDIEINAGQDLEGGLEAEPVQSDDMIEQDGTVTQGNDDINNDNNVNDVGFDDNNYNEEKLGEGYNIDEEQTEVSTEEQEQFDDENNVYTAASDDQGNFDDQANFDDQGNFDGEENPDNVRISVSEPYIMQHVDTENGTTELELGAAEQGDELITEQYDEFTAEQGNEPVDFEQGNEQHDEQGNIEQNNEHVAGQEGEQSAEQADEVLTDQGEGLDEGISLSHQESLDDIGGYGILSAVDESAVDSLAGIEDGDGVEDAGTAGKSGEESGDKLAEGGEKKGEEGKGAEGKENQGEGEKKVEEGVINPDRDSRLKYIFRSARFFMMKSRNFDNVQLAKRLCVWATPPFNETRLNQAYRECPNVILIFSVQESGKYQGFARLGSQSQRVHPPVPWVLPAGFQGKAFNSAFKLDWICRTELSFSVTQDLQNPWNQNKPVRIGRDGQEVEPSVGERLCRMFPSDPYVDLHAVARMSKHALRVASGKAKDTDKDKSRPGPDFPHPMMDFPNGGPRHMMPPMMGFRPPVQPLMPPHFMPGPPQGFRQRLGPPPTPLMDFVRRPRLPEMGRHDNQGGYLGDPRGFHGDERMRRDSGGYHGDSSSTTVARDMRRPDDRRPPPGMIGGPGGGVRLENRLQAPPSHGPGRDQFPLGLRPDDVRGGGQMLVAPPQRRDVEPVTPESNSVPVRTTVSAPNLNQSNHREQMREPIRDEIDDYVPSVAVISSFSPNYALECRTHSPNNPYLKQFPSNHGPAGMPCPPSAVQGGHVSISHQVPPPQPVQPVNHQSQHVAQQQYPGAAATSAGYVNTAQQQSAAISQPVMDPYSYAALVAQQQQYVAAAQAAAAAGNTTLAYQYQQAVAAITTAYQNAMQQPATAATTGGTYPSVTPDGAPVPGAEASYPPGYPYYTDPSASYAAVYNADGTISYVSQTQAPPTSQSTSQSQRRSRSRSPHHRSQDRRHGSRDGRHGDGRHSSRDGRHSDSRHSDSRHSDSRHGDSRHGDSRHGDYHDDRRHSDRHRDESHRHSDRRYEDSHRHGDRSSRYEDHYRSSDRKRSGSRHRDERRSREKY